jgi:hypothetical protein
VSEHRAGLERAGLAAYADVGLGLVEALTTSFGHGREMIEHGIATFEELHDASGATTGLAALSWVQAVTRRFDHTDEIQRQAIASSRASGSDIEIGIAESAMAQYAMVSGNRLAALTVAGASLDHLATARHIASTILTLEIIAELGLAAGLTSDAVTLFGATGAVRAAMGTQLPPSARGRLDELTVQTRSALGPHEHTAALDRGGSLTFQEAVDHGYRLIRRMGSNGGRGRTPE